MNTNLLDLDDNILNFIGDNVKKDNIERIEKEKKEAYEYVNKWLKKAKKEIWGVKESRSTQRKLIYQFFSSIGYEDDDKDDEEIIYEYLTLKRLNLKKIK
jgi:hypothetical protein